MYFDFGAELPAEIRDLETWDGQLTVDTVEASEKAGVLLVYVTWKDGRRTMHPSNIANKRCPQAVIHQY